MILVHKAPQECHAERRSASVYLLQIVPSTQPLPTCLVLVSVTVATTIPILALLLDQIIL